MQIRRLMIPVSIALALSAAALIATGQTPAQPNAGAQASNRPWTPVKNIDFSPRHNALIRNWDGTVSAMDEPYYITRLIAPGTWQILTDGDFMYLVEGDNEAVMIDSGYAVGNIREYAQSLTKKPLRYVFNTHPHFDHTANNAYFERAYMSADTKANLPMPSAAFAGINFPRDFPIEVIGDGFKYQLGNRDLEAFVIPNHAAGSAAFLDRKNRILFSGDEIMGQQGVRINVSVAQFERNMEKIAAHRSEYDTLCAGWEMLEATWVDKYLAIAKYILAGNEGVPVAQAPPAPDPRNWPTGPPPADAAGRTVYTRHVPRSGIGISPGSADNAGRGQAPAAGRGQAPNAAAGRGAATDSRRMTYGGATVTYDAQKIKD